MPATSRPATADRPSVHASSPPTTGDRATVGGSRRRRTCPSLQATPESLPINAPYSGLAGMADSELAIVIAGRRGDWPGGPRTLMPRDPNGTLWFGADLDPDGDQVWFRIGEEAVGRMPAETPLGRGHRLVDPSSSGSRWTVSSSPASTASRSWCRRPVRRGSNACGGEDGSARPDPSRRTRARGSGAGRPPARRGLRQPEHPEGARGDPAPPRRPARRAASRGRDARRLPRRAPRAGKSPVERVDGVRALPVKRHFRLRTPARRCSRSSAGSAPNASHSRARLPPVEDVVHRSPQLAPGPDHQNRPHAVARPPPDLPEDRTCSAGGPGAGPPTSPVAFRVHPRLVPVDGRFCRPETVA